MPGTFQCTVVTPQQQVLDEAVTYVSVPAWDGQIGVAPQRAPLLVNLGDGTLRLDIHQGDSRWFFLSGGFAQMKDNRLTLLSDEAVPADQIDHDQAKAAYKTAQADKAVGDTQTDRRNRQLNRARAMLRLLDQRRD